MVVLRLSTSHTTVNDRKQQYNTMTTSESMSLLAALRLPCARYFTHTLFEKPLNNLSRLRPRFPYTKQLHKTLIGKRLELEPNCYRKRYFQLYIDSIQCYHEEVYGIPLRTKSKLTAMQATAKANRSES